MSFCVDVKCSVFAQSAKANSTIQILAHHVSSSFGSKHSICANGLFNNY